MRVKYLEIKEHLVELVRQGDQGDRLPSEADLSRKFSVSRITIRKAMEQLEAETLIMRKKGRGTYIGQPSAYTDGIKRLLVVCDLHFQPVLPPHMSRILNGCYAGSASDNCVFTLASSSLGRQALVDVARKFEVHGVIGIAPYESQNEILEELRLHGYPLLVVNRVLRNSHLSYISTDHTLSGSMGTEFLLERGHRRIGFATVIEGVSFTGQTYEGYEQAMRLGGGVLSDQGVIRMDREASLQRFRPAMLEQLERLIRDYRPTGLVIDPFEDMPAVLALIERLGLSIPGDLELVVHDLDNIGQHIPQRARLHEMHQPFFEMGVEAVKHMNQLIQTGGPRITRMLNPRLEVKTFESSPPHAERRDEHHKQQTPSERPLVGSP